MIDETLITQDVPLASFVLEKIGRFGEKQQVQPYGNKMKISNKAREAYAFLGLTLALSWFVFWGPLALFKVPAISFVSDDKGPWWAIALFITGGFVPSFLGFFLTWNKEGLTGLRLLGRRLIQFRLCWRWYLLTFLIVIAGIAGQITINRLLGNTFDGTLFLSSWVVFYQF